MKDIKAMIAEMLADVEGAQPLTPPEPPSKKTVLSKSSTAEAAESSPETSPTPTETITVVDTEYNDGLEIHMAEKHKLKAWYGNILPKIARAQIVAYNLNFGERDYDYREFLGYNLADKQIIFRLSSTQYYSLQCDADGAILDSNKMVRVLARLNNITKQNPRPALYDLKLTLRRPQDDAPNDENPDEG